MAYSGPALAASALSKAISDMFEGLLQGQRGALDTEAKIGQMGLEERKAALEQAKFPTEMERLRAETGLARAQTTRQVAETEGLYQKLPEETQLLRAQRGELDARSKLLLEQIPEARARTALTQAQADELNAKRGLFNEAVADWIQTRTRAAAQGRALTTDELLAFTRRHPFLFQGAAGMPAALLYDMNVLEKYLATYNAQLTQQEKLTKLLLDVDTQAAKQAGEFMDRAYGKPVAGEYAPEKAALLQWLHRVNRNRLLNSVGMPDMVSDAGPPPQQFVTFLRDQLRQRFRDADDATLNIWAYGIVEQMRRGGVSWEEAVEKLSSSLLGSRPAINRPPQPQAPPGTYGYPLGSRPSIDRPGEEKPHLRYSPSTRELTPAR